MSRLSLFHYQLGIVDVMSVYDITANIPQLVQVGCDSHVCVIFSVIAFSFFFHTEQFHGTKRAQSTLVVVIIIIKYNIYVAPL